MTIELTDAQEHRLHELAANTSLSAEDLARQGMDRFLAYREDLQRAVQRGWDDVLAGRLIDHEDVVKMMDEIIENG